MMELSLNYRILLLFFGVVMLLNCIQLLNTKKVLERRPLHHFPPAIVIERYKDDRNITQPEKNTSYIARQERDDAENIGAVETRSTEDIDNETCANTDYPDLEEEEVLPTCPQIPPNLGPLNLSAPLNVSYIFNASGAHKPKNCIARQQVAVIIPYSGKSFGPLVEFLNHIHPFLIKQQADYQIFIVSYDNKTEPINRGQLLNIGAMEAQKQRVGWSCLVFHDHELFPLDSRNLYRCGWYPRQLAATVQLTENGPKIHPAVGGAMAITPELFAKLNGFSNTLLGRDEDFVDFHKRLRWANLTLERTDSIIGSYRSTGSPPDSNATYSVVVSPFHLLDGLTSLSYNLRDVHRDTKYTLLTVSDQIPEKTGQVPSPAF